MYFSILRHRHSTKLIFALVLYTQRGRLRGLDDEEGDDDIVIPSPEQFRRDSMMDMDMDMDLGMDMDMDSCVTLLFVDDLIAGLLFFCCVL